MKARKNKTTGVYYWTAYINGKRVKRENKDWKSLKEAKAHYEQYLKTLPIFGNDTINPTIEEACTMFLKHSSLSQKKSTVLNKRRHLEAYLIPFMVDKNGKSMFVQSVQPSNIQEWQSHLLEIITQFDKPLKNSVLQQIQITIRLLFDYCLKFGYIKQNPFDIVPFVKRHSYEPPKEMTILTIEQFNLFNNSVDDLVHKTMFNVLYWCGLRIGELSALRISSYDRENRQLIINENYDCDSREYTTTKTGQSRVVDVPNVCAVLIEELIEKYQHSFRGVLKGNMPLFALDGIIDRHKLGGARSKYRERLNEKLEKDKKIPYFTLHDLRHTHVSTLISLNWTAFEISKRLGHSVQMVNETYGHLFPKRKQELLNTLNDFSYQNSEQNEKNMENGTNMVRIENKPSKNPLNSIH